MVEGCRQGSEAVFADLVDEDGQDEGLEEEFEEEEPILGIRIAFLKRGGRHDDRDIGGGSYEALRFVP